MLGREDCWKGVAAKWWVVGFCLWLGGCDSTAKNSGDSSAATNIAAQEYSGTYPIQATVTVGMVADLVREIGGKHLAVKQLMGSGVDPHLHKPNRDDSVAIRSADIVFYSGLMLEGKMAETLERTADKRRCFAAAESLPTEILADDPAQANHPDPHVWMNVELWRQVAQAISEELAEFDPTHREDFNESFRRLETKMRALHDYGIEIFKTVPESQRVLVTSHDAFRYFGEAYGIEVQAVQGISTESAPGLRRINELVSMLVDRKVRAIFIESSVPKDSIESLLDGAKDQGHEVLIGGPLYSDAMGSEGTYEGTYLGMMDHNMTAIAKALGGSPPEGGFRAWQAVASGSKGPQD